MRLFFDTSVLVPVFYADHHNHAVSASVFRSRQMGDSFCSLHTLGEVYATLTGLPVRPRIAGREGMLVLRQILDRLTAISLTVEEYYSAIDAASPAIVGGAAYDALIAHCALKAGAEILLTWNLRDFTRLGPAVSRLVRTPSQL